MRILKDETCEARDGAELALDVYLPDAEGTYPALLAYAPYGKALQDAVRFLPKQAREHSTLWDGTIEAGDIEAITEAGYAHVIADVRGTGDSGGRTVGFFDRAGEDGYDLVEWIADQPWCTGDVGGVGRSWFGTNLLFLAAADPPSLVGVFASGVFTDLYREFAYHGGVLNLFLYGLWDGRHGDSGIVAHDWASRERAVNGDDAFEAQLEAALEEPDLRQYPNLYQLLHYPEKNPLFVDLVLNDVDGEFYAERSPHERLAEASCPVYLSGAWSGTHAAPVYTAVEQLDVDHLRLLMTPPRLLERPYHEYTGEMLRWFDHLLGADRGFDDEPAVKTYVRGADRWRFEDRLVPERTALEALYLRNHGRLLPDPEPVAEIAPSGFTQAPPLVSSEIRTLTFRTEPFGEPTEYTGQAALELHAAIDATDTTWMAVLTDVAPTGDRFTLSRGYLRASHRAVEEARSAPNAPSHPHDAPDPVEPGAVERYRLAFAPFANEFGRGHRLELVVKSMELPFSDTSDLPPGSHHLPHAVTIAHRVYHDGDRPSRLVLPELPPAGEDRWLDPDDPAHPGPVR